MANSPTISEVEVKVRALVAEATGIDSSLVIPANDNGPAPNSLYSTVLTSIVRQEGIDAEKVADNSGDDTLSDVTVQGNRIGSFSIQFFRSGAADAAMDFLLYPETSVGQIYLAEQGLTWRTHGDIRDIAAVMGSKFEERKQVDVEIGWVVTKVDEVNSLASADIDFNLSSDGVNYEETLEVTE